jgi:hypothetical protein
MKPKLAYFGDGIEEARYHAGNKETENVLEINIFIIINEHSIKPPRTSWYIGKYFDQFFFERENVI